MIGKRKVLNDIASIKSGVLFSRRINFYIDGSVYVLTPNDVPSGDLIDINISIKDKVLADEETSPSNYLKKGDVVVLVKGRMPVAGVVGSYDKPMIASAFFMILSDIDRMILPEYLAVYINSDRAHRYFSKFTVGTSIPYTSKKILMDLPVNIVDIEKQKKIVELYKLTVHANQLNTEVIELRSKMIKGII